MFKYYFIPVKIINKGAPSSAPLLQTWAKHSSLTNCCSFYLNMFKMFRWPLRLHKKIKIVLMFIFYIVSEFNLYSLLIFRITCLEYVISLLLLIFVIFPYTNWLLVVPCWLYETKCDAQNVYRIYINLHMNQIFKS